jgi:hypothetical protein
MLTNTITKPILTLSAVAVASAVLTFFAGAGEALAPEPARLTGPLAGAAGTTAPAVYFSGSPTTVVKWSASYVSVVNPPAAGTPCGTADLGTGTATTKVIQAVGTYRRCQ